jgi:hypothetical protein
MESTPHQESRDGHAPCDAIETHESSLQHHRRCRHTPGRRQEDQWLKQALGPPGRSLRNAKPPHGAILRFELSSRKTGYRFIQARSSYSQALKAPKPSSRLQECRGFWFDRPMHRVATWADFRDWGHHHLAGVTVLKYHVRSSLGVYSVNICQNRSSIRSLFCRPICHRTAGTLGARARPEV